MTSAATLVVYFSAPVFFFPRAASGVFYASSLCVRSKLYFDFVYGLLMMNLYYPNYPVLFFCISFAAGVLVTAGLLVFLVVWLSRLDFGWFPALGRRTRFNSRNCVSLQREPSPIDMAK
jgi:hypothetical protein